MQPRRAYALCRILRSTHTRPICQRGDRVDVLRPNKTSRGVCSRRADERGGAGRWSAWHEENAPRMAQAAQQARPHRTPHPVVTYDTTATAKARTRCKFGYLQRTLLCERPQHTGAAACLSIVHAVR